MKRGIRMSVDDTFLSRLEVYAASHFRTVQSVMLEASAEFLARRESDAARQERRREARETAKAEEAV